MAITLVASVTAAPGVNGGTSSAIDTTGANLLILSAAYYAALTVSDNKGNVWAPRTQRTAGGARHQLFVAVNPVVGTGHTFTVTGTAIYPGVVVHAYAGPGGPTLFESEIGAAAAAGTSLATGSVTPTTAGSLIVSGLALEGIQTPSIDAGLTSTLSAGVGGTAIISTQAYLVQSTAAPISPTWTWSTSVANAASLAVFRPLGSPLVALGLAAGSSGGTTAAMDTTGATLLVASVAWVGGGTAAVSDSKGNTWVGLTTRQQGASGTSLRLFYCLAPVVGSGHTVTVSGASTFSAMQAYAFSTMGSYQTESGATATGAGPLATGSVTPSADGALVFTSRGADNVAETDAITPSGFLVTSVPGKGASNAHCGAGYYVQPTAAAINPTWAWTPNNSTQKVVAVAVFLPAAGDGAGGGGAPLWYL